jgi:uncharacterized membrane protein (DUF373 family)
MDKEKIRYMIVLIYLVSVAYCIYKMYNSYKRQNDPLYSSPGLETLAILVMAPVLMAVDVSMTWVRKYKEHRQEKEERVF